mmetsp:Transcript_33668/g.72825  ORF Transcript_33668/g.72825 Transcript_33668/m.72825 type:complete len:82 (+) Transcript_33668:2286-2531(+)
MFCLSMEVGSPRAATRRAPAGVAPLLLLLPPSRQEEQSPPPTDAEREEGDAEAARLSVAALAAHLETSMVVRTPNAIGPDP